VGVSGLSAGAVEAQAQAPTRLEAQLTGSGDRDGSGQATFRLYPNQGRVCATVQWRGIGKPNAAHIHRRSDGSIVVGLTGTVTGGRPCARGVPSGLINRIAASPGRYYFNVHNAAYPAGAIQGRLHR